MNKTSKIVVFTFLVLISIFPFLPLLLQSFAFEWRYPDLFPTKYALNAWKYILYEEGKTWVAVANTLVIALTVVVINIIFGLPAAKYLAKENTRFSTFASAIIFAPILIPPFISVMGIYFIFSKYGLTGNIIGVIVVHIIPTIPYSIRALIIGFKTLSSNYENVARVLGANGFKTYYYVIIPHLIPSIVAAASLTVLISASEYILTLLIGDSSVLTLNILIFPYSVEGDPSTRAAYVVLFIILNLAALLSIERILKRHYESILDK